MHQPRSSLAIALEDYHGPRPGIALTVGAVLLVAAVVVGVVHIIALGSSRRAIDEGSHTIQTLHSYNAALEVWRQMATDTSLSSPQQAGLRDSIALALQRQLMSLQRQLSDPDDRALIGEVLDDFTPAAGRGSEVGIRGREAMILLTAHQDSALFAAASQYQRSQYLAAVVIGLAVIAAGVLIVPLSWVYVRYKRGIPPGL